MIMSGDGDSVGIAGFFFLLLNDNGLNDRYGRGRYV